VFEIRTEIVLFLVVIMSKVSEIAAKAKES
jgi:hypothetical protein